MCTTKPYIYSTHTVCTIHALYTYYIYTIYTICTHTIYTHTIYPSPYTPIYTITGELTSTLKRDLDTFDINPFPSESTSATSNSNSKGKGSKSQSQSQSQSQGVSVVNGTSVKQYFDDACYSNSSNCNNSNNCTLQSSSLLKVEAKTLCDVLVASQHTTCQRARQSLLEKHCELNRLVGV